MLIEPEDSATAVQISIIGKVFWSGRPRRADDEEVEVPAFSASAFLAARGRSAPGRVRSLMTTGTSMEQPVEAFRFVVEPGETGLRLDVFLHGRLPGHSRTYLKDLARRGSVLVDGRAGKPAQRLDEGQTVLGTAVLRPEDGTLLPQDIPLDVLHEDASILVLNKAAGLVVHPGSGCRDQTLANGLAYRLKDLSDAGGPLRPGIVHRLDRDTSGVMVVAKTNAAHFSLASQFEERSTEKEYLAVVEGEPRLDADVISVPLGRSPRDRSRVVAGGADGKPSETRYEVVERFEGFAFLRCMPRTGRTHQIRVHLQSIGHPIVADPVYGRRKALWRKDLALVRDDGGEPILDRQALHALSLRFTHPLTGTVQAFEAPVPEDMLRTLRALRQYRPGRARKG